MGTDERPAPLDAVPQATPSMDEKSSPTPTTHGVRAVSRAHWPGFIALTVALLLSIPQLPPGVCLSDAGGFQTACATLGITHPPGYPLISLLGFPIAHLPGFEPAKWISIACLFCGLGACVCGYLVATRAGVRSTIAAAGMLLLVVQHRLWQGLLAPEVYAPALLMIAGGTLALQTFERSAGRPSLIRAGLAFGCALATRPPSLFGAPFFAAGTVLTIWRGQASRRRRWLLLMIAIGAVIAPVFVGGAYLFVRDSPTTTYNYLDTHNTNWQLLPNASEGVGARMERVWWLVSGEQFANRFGNTWSGIRTKLRWLFRNELIPGQSIASHLARTFWIPTTLLGLSAVVVGVWSFAQRSRIVAWSLMGCFAQSIVFVCAYRIHGQAANYLPLLWAAIVALTMTAERIVASAETKRRSYAGELLLLGVVLWVIFTSANRGNPGRSADAEGFLAEAALDSFPEDSVLIADWRFATPLWYAQFVRHGRDDLLVIAAEPHRANQLVDRYPNREVFLHSPHLASNAHRLEPYRNFFRVVRGGAATERAPKPPGNTATGETD